MILDDDCDSLLIKLRIITCNIISGNTWGVHKKNLRHRLVFKKSKRKSTHPPKNASRFFFVQSRPPLSQKN